MWLKQRPSRTLTFNLLAGIVIMAANIEDNLEELEAIVDGVSFFYEEGKGMNDLGYYKFNPGK